MILHGHSGMRLCKITVFVVEERTAAPGRLESNDSLYDAVVGLREISVIALYILDYKFDL